LPYFFLVLDVFDTAGRAGDLFTERITDFITERMADRTTDALRLFFMIFASELLSCFPVIRSSMASSNTMSVRARFAGMVHSF
jgi:hypothetical protein